MYQKIIKMLRERLVIFALDPKLDWATMTRRDYFLLFSFFFLLTFFFGQTRKTFFFKKDSFFFDHCILVILPSSFFFYVFNFLFLHFIFSYRKTILKLTPLKSNFEVSIEIDRSQVVFNNSCIKIDTFLASFASKSTFFICTLNTPIFFLLFSPFLEN